jgi:2-polyprenyl-6-methoxyphenol hydroxylase and related FAD-dependent oxidoreductases
MAPCRDFVSHQTGGSGSLPSSVPVLIVGGGPTGLLQALLLSRLGGMYVRGEVGRNISLT